MAEADGHRTQSLSRRMALTALAIVTVAIFAFPPVALARVVVDEQELAQGENAVGGGTATLSDEALDMANVTAGSMVVDEDLTVSFNGGNEIGVFDIEGSANVEVSFDGENAVEDIHAHNESNVTVNANGHDDVEEVEGFENANVTVNVTGENTFETIEGHDNANITVRGTSCQKRDVVNIGDGEKSAGLSAENGNVTIDHVTVNLESETARVGSQAGDVKIDTSKIASGDDNECTEIVAGGTMSIAESVIDITGTVHSDGFMTIEHSDVKADAPDSRYGSGPYRIYSKTGIALIREKNGEVKNAELDGDRIWYVDTGDGEDVDLEADGVPGYHRCCKNTNLTSKTGDDANPLSIAFLAFAGAATTGYAFKRRRDDAS